VRTPIAGDTLEKIYFTGTDKPRVTTKDLYDDGTPGTSIPPASYILGIPAPDTAPVATDSAAGNIAAGTYTWVFTFVRTWSDGTSDEGAPSVPSNSLTLAAGRQVSVTLPNGGMTVPGDYGITHKRLYRSIGGAYFLVVQVTIGTSPTTDNVATPNLGPEITTTNYLPPPDAMIGIVELANGVIAGFKGNIVYLSEPYRPWAFPALNQYAVSWPIVAIGGYATTVVVATKAYPYIGRGLDPAAYSFKPQVGALYPCISKRSMASGAMGVFWATNDGIALANEGGVSLATKEFLTNKEWLRDFFPTTMHGVVYEGRYYGWFSTGTFGGNKIGSGIVLDRSEPAFLSTLGEYVEAATVVPDTGKLHISKKATNGFNFVFAFDTDPAIPAQFEWKSKVFISNGLENFGFAQIIANYGAGLSSAQIAQLTAQIASIQAYNAAIVISGGAVNEALVNDVTVNGDNLLLDAPSSEYISATVNFFYWAEGVLRLSRTVEDQEPFPMPAGFRGEKHEFQLTGEVEVYQVTLATSVEELATV